MLYVPIMWNTLNEHSKNVFLNCLKTAKADVVFIAIGRDNLYMTEEERRAEFESLAPYVTFFKTNGFEVGIWLDTFGFGGEVPDKYAHIAKNWTRVTDINGADLGADFCSEDANFADRCRARICDVARYLKPDRIMIDDELCYSSRPGLGCFCDEHMKLYEKELGKAHTKEELKNLIFTGFNEKYRLSWVNVCKNSLQNFCKSLRSALDTVNPEMRLGLCSGFQSWDFDGATPIELCKILAGKTKPFLRLAGAPYWVRNAMGRFTQQQLNSVIELIRMQAGWCENENIELLNEGDAFPRPRYMVSASMCECYDIPLLASGNIGRFKYMFSYDAQPAYEMGYYKKHMKNMPLCDFIEKNFSEKSTVGVRVYEKMHKFDQMRLPDEFIGDHAIMSTGFSPASFLLADHCIPTTHTGSCDIAIAFGENVRYIENMPKKLIIDAKAAEFLNEQGYSLGISKKSEDFFPQNEYFVGGEKTNLVTGNCTVSKYTLGNDAKIESEFSYYNENMYPASYQITENGTEFLVFLFDAYKAQERSSFFLSYERQKQLLNFTEARYPHIKGTYGIYTLVKDGPGERAVLFENLGEDEWENFEIILDKKYSSAQIFGADAEFFGDKIKIKSEFLPYSTIACVLND